jgi:hypothetical protein
MRSRHGVPIYSCKQRDYHFDRIIMIVISGIMAGIVGLPDIMKHDIKMKIARTFGIHINLYLNQK